MKCYSDDRNHSSLRAIIPEDPVGTRCFLLGICLDVAYMCQQAVEKILKAFIVQLGKENFPIHNLNRLAEVATISNELTSEQFNFLAELTPYHIEARYGDYEDRLAEIVNSA